MLSAASVEASLIYQEKRGMNSDSRKIRFGRLLKIVDPDTAISMIRNFINNIPITLFYSWTLAPGLPPHCAQAHLELFASKVIPACR